MLLIIRVLNLAAAGGFVHGRAHGGGDFVGVKKHPALGVSRGAADGLNEARLRAEEAFFICVQNRNERHLRQIQTLAQEVDANEHVELCHAQIADDLHALHGSNIRVHIAHANSVFGEVFCQVLGHFFGQRGDQGPLALRGRGVDFADQIVDLPFDRADEDLRVKKTSGADELFGNIGRVLALVVAGCCRDENRLMNLGFELIEFERSVIVR